MTSRPMLSPRLVSLLVYAAETTRASPVDPGFGATVPSPPRAIMVAAWVVGIVALAILWAVSRR